MEGTLRERFKQLLGAWEQHNKSGLNYVMYQLLQLVGAHEFLQPSPPFRMINNHQTLKELDTIWSQLCTTLGWTFHSGSQRRVGST